MKPVFQRAFTLIEVNLAMLVMAGGVLSMVSLYAFGFRENRQSREDVAGAVVAESLLNALATVLSSRDLKWSQWENFGENPGDTKQDDVRTLPKDGWKYYLQSQGTSDRSYRVKTELNSISKNNVFDKLLEGYSPTIDGLTISKPDFGQIVKDDQVSCALVATRETKKSPVMTLAVRVVRKKQERTLFAQPIYFTEVHFQGKVDTN